MWGGLIDIWPCLVPSKMFKTLALQNLCEISHQSPRRSHLFKQDDLENMTPKLYVSSASAIPCASASASLPSCLPTCLPAYLPRDARFQPTASEKSEKLPYPRSFKRERNDTSNYSIAIKRAHARSARATTLAAPFPPKAPFVGHIQHTG